MALPVENPPESAAPRKHRMSTRNRFLFFAVAWAIVLMPFLFWRATWFGRPLTSQQMQQYLHDDSKPRNIQHALVQVGEMISRHDPAAVTWYPDLVRLASYPVEEVRNTDAWVMGQDNSRPEFHQALLGMLGDHSQIVRGNAALSLVRFGDASGRSQLTAMLQPITVAAPQAGKLVDLDKPGAVISEKGLVAKLEAGGNTLEVRSPIAGRIRGFSVEEGAQVAAGATIATVDPAEDQVWEALRGLYLIGQKEDLPAVISYQHPLPDMPDRVRQQAIETAKAIRKRAGE